MDQVSKKSVTQITVRELFIQLKLIWSHLFANWKKILVIAMIGAAIGVTYAFMVPVRYMSRVTFVVEESKSGGGSLAAIAGQFGIDLGGAMGGGVFSGDNILLFLKSEYLCRKTLLSPYDSLAKGTLADRYAEVRKWKDRWRKNKAIGEIDFSLYTFSQLPRKEDSLLQLITKEILTEGGLDVSKPDKKSTFIDVRAILPDEKLSYIFSTRLVSNATESYVQSKIKVKQANLLMLQRRADSLAMLLNSKTYSAASSQQVLVDVNPALRSAPIAAEISGREKTMISTIFAEVVKNLEISKTIINQETPVIQIVDVSSYPLNKIKIRKLTSLIIGGILAAFSAIVYLMLRRWIKQQFSNN